jgi:hypothetical protein
MKRLLVLGALALAACEPKAAETAKPAEPAAPAAQAAAPAAEPAAAPAQASGPAKQLAAQKEDMPEAYVTDVKFLKESDAKIFSTAGGDPAINGLYTYLAVMGDSPGDGWTVFMLGDFNEWKIIEDAPGKVVLQVSRSWIEEKTSDIKTVQEKLIVAVPKPGETNLSVTPAT